MQHKCELVGTETGRTMENSVGAGRPFWNACFAPFFFFFGVFHILTFMDIFTLGCQPLTIVGCRVAKSWWRSTCIEDDLCCWLFAGNL